jgi:hypothetical protein
MRRVHVPAEIAETVLKNMTLPLGAVAVTSAPGYLQGLCRPEDLAYTVRASCTRGCGRYRALGRFGHSHCRGRDTALLRS